MVEPKIVLVTAATTGLGQEIIRAHFRSSAPYEILLGAQSLSNSEVTLETLKQELPLRPSSVSTFQLDILDDDSIRKPYRTISGMYDRLDVLIKNARTSQSGMHLPSGDRTSHRMASNMTYDVNVVGTHIFNVTFVAYF